MKCKEKKGHIIPLRAQGDVYEIPRKCPECGKDLKKIVKATLFDDMKTLPKYKEAFYFLVLGLGITVGMMVALLGMSNFDFLSLTPVPPDSAPDMVTSFFANTFGFSVTTTGIVLTIVGFAIMSAGMFIMVPYVKKKEALLQKALRKYAPDLADPVKNKRRKT